MIWTTGPGWRTCTGPPPPGSDARSRCWYGSSTTADDGRENPATDRLFTTLLDPVEAPAADLAAAYAQRWEIEPAFGEPKTHQRGPRTVLRSKSPDLVLQEIWGHLCCHSAIRSIMAQAATHAGHDPDRVSFAAGFRITRPTIAHPFAFSPDRDTDPHDRDGPGWVHFLRRLLRRLNPAYAPGPRPASSSARCGSGTSNAHHAGWPQPQHPPRDQIQSPN